VLSCPREWSLSSGARISLGQRGFRQPIGPGWRRGPDNCEARQVAPMKIHYKIITLIFFIGAIFLRISLCALNPPDNAFDNHFEPISLIMQYGKIPAKNACWECVQPPVFYVVSAIIGRLSFDLGAKTASVKKILQFVCCFYGILTLFVILLILDKFPLSDFSKLISFGFVCFLPRHIYMSAMHSNDTMAYLFVAICIYVLIINIEQNFPLRYLIVLSIVISITIFIKYNTLVVIPIAVIVFMLWIIYLTRAQIKTKILLFGVTLILPLSIFITYVSHNVKNHGKALPGNYEIFVNPLIIQPRDEEKVNFVNFKPWESIATPILVPGKLSSFWTLIYSGMWFDTEPKFICFMDSNTAWWRQYFGWQNGEQRFPGPNYSMSKLTKLEGSALITLGIFPLLLGIIGFIYYIRNIKINTEQNWHETIKMSIFPVLIITNIAGIIAITMKFPLYSFMKASYFLVSLPAFAIYLSLGVMACENRNPLKWAIIIIFGALFLLVFSHIFHILSFLYQIKV
jgi:4-amino-4-deoxy-L-arabinose transferase-like glycosyltransferase